MDVEWDTWGATDVWACVRAYGTKALRCLKLVLLGGGANFPGEKKKKLKRPQKKYIELPWHKNGNNLIYLQIAFL